MREAVLHRPDIGKGPARVANGEGRAFFTTEEKEARVLFGRVGGLFFVGVDVIEHRLTRGGPLAQRVHYLRGLIGVYMAVPGEAQRAERVTAHVPALYREEQPPVISENRVVCNGVYTRFGGVRAVLSIRR